MFLRRRSIPLLGRWRRKLLRETEAALLFGLLHPERNPRIPTVLVGAGRFDARWAQRWWNTVLELKDEDGARKINSNNDLPDGD